MDNLNKILDTVVKTGKQVILVRENGDCFVVSKFSDTDNVNQKILDFSEKSNDNYPDLVRKTIMP